MFEEFATNESEPDTAVAAAVSKESFEWIKRAEKKV